jgi:hypothetical protein
MAFQLNGNPINIDRPYVTETGVKYANLRNPAIREQLGVVEVPDAPTYDQRFYWGVDNPKLLDDREEVDEEGNPLWVKVLDNTDPENPVMVDSDVRLVTKGLKSQWIAQVKQTAGSLLAQTDWMVIRKAERDVAIPDAVQTYRAAVVAEADRLETAIAGCADVPALIAVVSAQDWPKAE